MPSISDAGSSEHRTAADVGVRHIYRENGADVMDPAHQPLAC
ncbi:hypothetical protein I540_5838 [Mycobacteroides abscessus subsp. bolletii 1513]|uniref:Uncharacterized protein n=1 Tax=Mycobacteroides abscessus subsp. bolletii 1513 TaxID=1299321 RepID=X8DFH9_9MYCO|nr:hypothetical protein I540_5838 [Mycobacteroides abscessus subsp. bolletii 1513]